MSENNKLKDSLKAITTTLIFEASALNRDEKLGGNIPSIKKLTRADKGTFGYISREAMRHYLFESLSKLYKDPWIPANCFESGTGDRKVVQFDLRTQNILTHAELDAFGYMFTIGGQSSITRKAPVGITKAVALERWEGDMQFNANHDLAQRCGANPNPVNKEEQMSYFKVTFTIDVERLGYDEWWIMDHKYEQGILNLELSDKKEHTHTIEAEKENNVEENQNEKYAVKNKEGYTIGCITIEQEGSKKKAIFRLNEREKWKRVCQILKVLKNGLIYHSSGENWGIVPQFLISAGLKLPIPLFHSFVELGSFEESVFDNSYILSNDNEKKLIYLYDPKQLVGRVTEKRAMLYEDWSSFLTCLSSKCNESEKSEEMKK